ncbi:UDP-glucose:undecaprenyl-phosphate glucose-1-phosphate transferase [Boseongicola aestuarii]|uniref:UDP-glucose:undecaprenyl-phosphate glucose-1-phosphate transferase n=1 Tax=Boseongicola aestuarii TaxID=1470561 RepID=A0A238IY92_9RHOB|nr:UDP-glucose:undecaprenyl-phosphate glucose-1-phosphate transferase [Boseongicola aestuarii]
MTVHVTNVVNPTAANVDALPISGSVKARGIYRSGLKRVVDITLVLISLPFVAPFLALIAVAIASDGHSPIFRQERVGRDGRRFTIWKFRTMVPDAEVLLETHLSRSPSARSEWDTKQKLENDPRCTRIGRALRRTSIDEMPQIINVLIGDMSLVGPRPMLPSQQALYPGRSYYSLRPGMTGLWQVSKRNQTEFADRAYYDDSYDLSLSAWQDLKILAKTMSVVIRGTGI